SAGECAIASRVNPLLQAMSRPAMWPDGQCMKIAIRMITGIGTPRNHSSNERMMFLLVLVS
ncbi:MAG: hypothetical protein ACN6QH_13955, partial [Pseudomonas sp.]|uniref:hypothetical protein n=1 Tax=Pseudomonas sp. TaxID=306 RepID=UPI003D0CF26D